MLAEQQSKSIPLFMRKCDIANKTNADFKEGVDYLYDEETQKSNHTQYMGVTGYTTRNGDGNEDFQKTDNSWVSPEYGPQ
jgi:hypothetical protein